MRYLPAPGAHINKDEAQIIGNAITEARNKFGEAFTVRQFERLCANRRNPVHKIWKKKRDELAEAAGRAAAAYLMRSVVIEKSPDADELPKAVTIIMGDDRNGRVYSPDIVAASPDLLEQFQEQYESTLRGISRNFSDVAGISRMMQANQNVMSEFVLQQANRPPPAPPPRRRRTGT